MMEGGGGGGTIKFISSVYMNCVFLFTPSTCWTHCLSYILLACDRLASCAILWKTGLLNCVLVAKCICYRFYNFVNDGQF